MKRKHPSYGVVLLNMGGPSSLADVEPYLERLFADPMIVSLPLGGLWQGAFARLLARKRAPKSRERYRLIGGGSPLLAATKKQAKGLSHLLGVPVAIAMRYSDPGAPEALARLADEGVTRIVALPLYPQRCRATTDSSLADLARHNRSNLPIRAVEDHHDDPGYIAVLVSLLRRTLASVEGARCPRVLFAAHSVPVSLVQGGDPYVPQVAGTAARVAEGAGLEPGMWQLAFQSRIGPARWQGPSLEEAWASLRSEGCDALVVQPLSFVAENLETLYDLDLVFRDLCRDGGLERYIRVPVPGDSPEYLEVLATRVRALVETWDGEVQEGSRKEAGHA